MIINEQRLGEYYIGPDGRIYQLVMYCKEPTAVMQEVGTDRQIEGSVCSRNLEGFKHIEDKETFKLLDQLKSQIEHKG